MSEEMNLVRDLAVILVSAGIFTIISKALKQPLILGYIIAGFLVGPSIDFFPGISSAETVSQWSDIGIIFLMFGLGLEFSFKKLLKVGASALTVAGVKFLGVFVIGFTVGTAMDWTTMECIFLGGLLSMSSTMVVVKSYDDMGLKDKPYASLVFGTLVVEDLIAIILMVLYSTIAVSNSGAAGEIFFNLGKLIFFIILWFLIGIYMIPTLLKKASKYINDEILLIVVIGLCFGMVTLAEAVGFSSALGAFVMGSILAETVESEHIEKIATPIKDLFGAIFFVSVGMMVSPAVIVEHWAVILILALTVIITHILFAGAGALAMRKGLENSLRTGFSLAQLGEFGFILAGVGVSLGVMNDWIYPCIIAVSVITTFTTPYMIRLAGPVQSLLERKLPEKVLHRLNPSEEVGSKTVAERSEWKKLLQSYMARIVLYGVILIAIILGSSLYLEPLLDRFLPDVSQVWRDAIAVGGTLLIMSPFLYGMAVNTGAITNSTRKLIKEDKNNLWPILGLMVLRMFIAIGFILVVILSHFHLAGWTLVVIVTVVLALLLAARRYMHRFSAVEQHFFSNLNEKENLARKNAPVVTSINDSMAGYDVHTEYITLNADSAFAGKKMKDVPFRSESGANIIKIRRGTRDIVIPSGSEVLFPGDRLLAVGTTEQIGSLKEMIKASNCVNTETPKEFKVVNIILDSESYLTGKILRETGLRDYHCMIVSVVRNGEFMTNPKPDFRFSEGDIVWLAGETESCEWLSGTN